MKIGYLNHPKLQRGRATRIEFGHTESDSKFVKMGKISDSRFLMGLKDLRQDLRDVFAWEYFEIKGIDLAFH